MGTPGAGAPAGGVVSAMFFRRLRQLFSAAIGATEIAIYPLFQP
jgi:hypothetical protein